MTKLTTKLFIYPHPLVEAQMILEIIASWNPLLPLVDQQSNFLSQLFLYAFDFLAFGRFFYVLKFSGGSLTIQVWGKSSCTRKICIGNGPHPTQQTSFALMDSTNHMAARSLHNRLAWSEIVPLLPSCQCIFFFPWQFPLQYLQVVPSRFTSFD